MTEYRSLGARPDATRGTLAVEVRKSLAALFEGPGVLPGSSSPLVTGESTFAYVVRTGAWVTSRGTSDGAHLWGNDGDVTLSLDDTGASLAAPSAGLSRIDIIYALQRSDSENGDADSEAVLAVRKGTEGSPGIAPSLPTGALELARNTMQSTAVDTAGSGNTISQSAARAGLSGAVSAAGGLASTGVAHRGFGQVSLTGALTLSAASLSIVSTFNQVGTIPAGFRPTEALLVGVMTSNGRPVQGQIGTNGAVYVRSMTGDFSITTGQSIPLAQFGPYRVA